MDAKFRQKQAESQGRLESVSLEGISLGAGKRRPSRRSQYENLLKVAPLLLMSPMLSCRSMFSSPCWAQPCLKDGRHQSPGSNLFIGLRQMLWLSASTLWHLMSGGLKVPWIYCSGRFCSGTDLNLSACADRPGACSAPDLHHC